MRGANPRQQAISGGKDIVNEANIRRYATNLFAYPTGYFEQHTAEEPRISEKDRQELIRLHGERKDTGSDQKRADRIKEFGADFFA